MNTHLAKAIEQIQDKHEVPELDFTQHKLEDGTSISTQERVIKDVGLHRYHRAVWLTK